jgi:hypothetical protein
METMDRLPYALSKKTLLETALIRCSRAAVVVSLDEIMRRIEELKLSLDDGSGAPRDPAVGIRPMPAERVASSGEREASTAPAQFVAKPKGEGPIGDELAHLIKMWPELVEKIGKAVALAKGCLLDARPVAVVGDRVTIGFDQEFAARMEQAGMPRTRAALQKTLDDALCRPVTVDFQLLAERTAPAETESVETLQCPPGGTRPQPARNAAHSFAGGSAGKPSLQQKQKWFKDPAVQKTMDMFNGDIQEVRE